MEFKTAEERLLHDYARLEDENMRLADENRRLVERILEVEGQAKRARAERDALAADLADATSGELAHRLEIERDHHADCVKDMLATAAFYGFEQPTRIMYNPETGTMKPAGEREDDEKCVIYSRRDEGLA